jgi:hypothetical protein
MTAIYNRLNFWGGVGLIGLGAANGEPGTYIDATTATK